MNAPTGTVDTTRIVQDAENRLARARAEREEIRLAMLARVNAAAGMRRIELVAGGEYRVRVPPTGWSFMTKLSKRLKTGAIEPYGTGESNDWRSFMHWYRVMDFDCSEVAAVLVHFGDRTMPVPREREGDLRGRVWRESQRLKAGYQALLEDGKIQWLPARYFTAPIRDPRRSEVHVVDFLARALVEFDDRDDTGRLL